MSNVKRQLFPGTPRHGKRRRTGPSIASTVRNLAETKYKNTSIVHSAVSTSNTELTSIATGNTVGTRDGRKVLITAQEIRFNGLSGGCRMILYSPKDPNTTLTLTNPSDAVDNDEFWVIEDRTMTANGDNNLAVNTRMFNRMAVEYTGTANTSGIKNRMFLYIHSIANATTFTGHTKVWYKDI